MLDVGERELHGVGGGGGGVGREEGDICVVVWYLILL
jgi:hypothetical protein